jgi:hypothetical protein
MAKRVDPLIEVLTSPPYPRFRSSLNSVLFPRSGSCKVMSVEETLEWA